MCLLIKKNNDDRKSYSCDRFLCQIQILLLNMYKLLKIPGVNRFFVQNSSFLFKFLNLQVSRGFFAQVVKFRVFQGKIVTLFFKV